MDKNSKNEEQENQVITRAPLPKGKEVIGIVEQRVGGIRMIVKCFDDKTRNCRVPGRLQRNLWLREGDIVIVEPWEYDDSKGDIIYKYNNSQIEWLKRRGFLKIIEEKI
ncbi:MAG: translation initiation factor eIF-1A [Candidatus Pacearchaeota archaeon]